ncbi:MAG: amino acid permease [Actinobacteria bacterium HGW-Actinobacteria-10]|jgi:amino acid transporter|nr:MAG: amino acid permease [Actinobacteria bacterium HGW-Actinobacteria-10]
MASVLKRLLLGSPLHNKEAAHQRLSNPVALAVFSSDALSSVAYATGEVVLMLALAGAAALTLTLPIALAVGTLLLIVVTSYRQTIRSYPGGGGAYIVAKENLGAIPGLVAGASLLLDYVLTVAVSISAGVAAITSAWPASAPYRVEMALAFIAMLAIANLRGVRESGAIFAGPTYAFVLLVGLTVVAGLVRFATGDPFSVPVAPDAHFGTQALTTFLILKAFSSGCTAMTGVEAIANGVTAFKEPSARNAARTLLWMAGILLFLFVGVSALAVMAGVQPTEETVISQLSRAIFGTGPLYYLISLSVMTILILAANTSYADFPRLASFVAEDDYLPHHLRNRGYRLVYSNGILLLTAAAAGLVVLFGGVVTRLIPLYAVGVFTSFTLSQAGMVVHHFRYREERWRLGALINGLGATATGVVLVVIATAKFAGGAWLVLILIPVIMGFFLWVKQEYRRVAEHLAIRPEELTDLNWQSANRMHNHVVLLVKSIDRRLIRALQYAKTLRADEVEALYVDIGGNGDAMRKAWADAGFGIRLKVIESPYREVIRPVCDYVRAIERSSCDDVITVIVPEFAPDSLPDTMLHDQTSFWLKQTLFGESGVIIADVPYHMDDPCPLGGTA